MKSALVSAIRAFATQVRENTFELAKKTVERNGYQVSKVTKVKETNKK